MDEDECGSSGVWDICSDMSLDYTAQFITGINIKWDYVLLRIIALLVWIGLWNKLRIYILPPDPVIWSCWGFAYL